MKPKPLALLRLLVLREGEQQPALWWNSTGLQPSGQTDLRFLFPRTAISAAAKHAQFLAQAHHDSRTRAQGVRHLFRLPIGLEISIHRALLELEASGKLAELLPSLAWESLEGVSLDPQPPQEGPVNLGSVDLGSRAGLSKIAATYRAAFRAGIPCVPYFQIPHAA